MPTYTKAYYLRDLRRYGGWDTHAAAEASTGSTTNDGPTPLDDETIVYLHESLVVTRDIFEDRDVLFDAVTPQWRNFCQGVLVFEVPDWDAESARVRATLASTDGNTSTRSDG